MRAAAKKDINILKLKIKFFWRVKYIFVQLKILYIGNLVLLYS